DAVRIVHRRAELDRLLVVPALTVGVPSPGDGGVIRLELLQAGRIAGSVDEVGRVSGTEVGPVARDGLGHVDLDGPRSPMIGTVREAADGDRRRPGAAGRGVVESRTTVERGAEGQDLHLESDVVIAVGFRDLRGQLDGPGVGQVAWTEVLAVVVRLRQVGRRVDALAV